MWQAPLAVLLTNGAFFNISVALELMMTFCLTNNNTLQPRRT
jgi:hypothetical protein